MNSTNGQPQNPQQQQATSVATFNIASVNSGNPVQHAAPGNPSSPPTFSATPLTPVEFNLQLAAQEEVFAAPIQPQVQHRQRQAQPHPQFQQQQQVQQRHHTELSTVSGGVNLVQHAPAIITETEIVPVAPENKPSSESNTGVVLSSTRPLIARKSVEQPSPPRERPVERPVEVTSSTPAFTGSRPAPPSEGSSVTVRTRSEVTPKAAPKASPKSKSAAYYTEHHEAYSKVEMASLCNLFADEIDRIVARFLSVMSRDTAYLILLAVGSAFAALYLDISPIWMMTFISLVSIVLFKYLKL